jgi:GxxExxY protein
METPTAKEEPSKELDRLAREVIGAAIEVHRAPGPGYLESVYEEAMTVGFGLPFERQPAISVGYKGRQVGEGRLDFLVGGVLVVELKTIEEFAPIHTAQVIAYLKATNCRLGLLINFNVPVLKDGVKRIVRS